MTLNKTKLNLSYRPGLRTIKTVIAVFITLLIGNALGRRNIFYGLIASVICLQKSGKETFKKGLSRMMGTFIGGGFGWLALELFMRIDGNYRDFSVIFLVPVGLLIVIWFMNVFNVKSSIVVGCIVFIGCTAGFHETIDATHTYVINRVIDTLIGIGSAIIVNFDYKQLLNRAKCKKFSEIGKK